MTFYASHGILRVPTTFYASHHILRVPTTVYASHHILRVPTTVYASQQQFTRPIIYQSQKQFFFQTARNAISAMDTKSHGTRKLLLGRVKCDGTRKMPWDA
ncbi:hypothetical protein niasHT_017483 [Heterodera trifolii]|uniref:Uncharacterized protein n=1 Tax=Heterodera trifolii TaxID=157864 RepID=A0ABD2LF94_9BILA